MEDTVQKILQEVLDIRKDLDKDKNLIARITGRREQLTKQLKELKAKSLQDAKNRVERLKPEVDRLTTKLTKLMRDYEKKWQDKLGSEQ